MNAMHGPVIHRTHAKATFERAPRLLHPLQLLVTQRQVAWCQAIVIAVDHEFAVKLLGLTPLRRINPQ